MSSGIIIDSVPGTILSITSGGRHGNAGASSTTWRIMPACRVPSSPCAVNGCGNAEAGLVMERGCIHREILEEIVSESARMTRLVEDLLFLARSDVSSVPLHFEAVPAEPLLLELAERARMLVQRQGSTLVTGLAGRGTLNVDVARIEQAVMILVDNAAKYSPPRSTVRLSSSSWNEEFTIEVADEGPGMRQEDISLIFDRFKRIDNGDHRRTGGAGLGLPIARAIIDAHHGRIDVQSQPGDGKKMRIHLPLGQLVAVESPEPVSSELQVASWSGVQHG